MTNPFTTVEVIGSSTHKRKNNLIKITAKRGQRTASKTVRENTLNGVKNSLKEPPVAICVNLDWFSYMADFPGLEKPTQEDPVRSYEGTVVLEWTGKGGGGFEAVWNVYVHGEHVATLLSHYGNPKFIKPGVVKVEILNHVHYSYSTIEVYNQILDATGMFFRNINRVDISIDGNNRVYNFLNYYAKQHPGTARIHLMNGVSFDPKMMQRFMYQAFKIGRGHKYITVYNKSQEIRERSHKGYITEVWRKNGLITCNAEGEVISEDVWRTELRMTSQAVKEFKDLDVDRLLDPKYLLQVFKTQADGLLKFVEIGSDSNYSRARRLDLFDFYYRDISSLDKIPRHKIEGNYKAKMGIHNDIKDMIQGYMTADEAGLALLNIRRLLSLYDLWDHYKKKLPQWLDRYRNIKYDPNIGQELRLLASGN